MNVSSNPSGPLIDRRLAELLSLAFDGVLDRDRFAELQDRLKDDPAARRVFIDQMLLDAALAEEFSVDSIGGAVDILSCGELPSENGISPAPSALRGGATRGTQRRRVAAWLAAGLVLIVVGGWAIWLDGWRNVLPVAGADEKLATIVRTQHAWPKLADQPFHAGQALGAGRIDLAAGLLEIAMSSGVTIVMEGPGELELQSPMRVFLSAGDVVVRVPESAIGFRLDTPTAELVDLGTEFAVKAGGGLNTDVQVYAGAVLATPRGAGSGRPFPRRIRAGEAVRFAPQTGLEPSSIAYSDGRFVRRLPRDGGVEHPKRYDDRYFKPSLFESLRVTRPARPVVVDGRLDEWDSNPGFRRALHDTEDEATGAEYVAGRMMFDEQFLYIAAQVGDPAPLANRIDPELDRDVIWRGGAVQVRISTDRSLGWPVDANGPSYYQARRLAVEARDLAAATNPHLVHLTMWHHAPSGQARLHVAYGMDFHGEQLDPAGFRGVLAPRGDSPGYVLEYAVPWTLLNAAADPPRAGDRLAVSWTVHWSDESGRRWRDQLVEIRNSREPLRIFTWERAATWGRAEFR